MIPLLVGWALAAPPVVQGDYSVTRVQPPGEKQPQNFQTFMHHQAMASGDSCHTIERHYDFGVAPEGAEAWRPARVTVAETITCTRGGIGTYHLASSLELPARWEGEAQEVLVLDGGTVIGRVTRLERPRDVGVPALWVGEEHVYTVEPLRMILEAGAGRRNGLPSLRARIGDAVYLMDPAQARGGR